MYLTSCDILADMHTHTNFSLHAYSTIKENYDKAKEKGLCFMAVTDHYYNDGTDLDKKNEINRIRYAGERINHYSNEVKIISSAEFNLNQPIYTPEKLKDIRWRPIGLHNWFLKVSSLTYNELFEYFVKAKDLGFNSFNHIERELFKISTSFEEQMAFLKRVVDFAKENDIWLEVNESSISFPENGSIERLNAWVEYARKNENKICIGSDAHYCEEVGRFDKVLEILNRVDYPHKLILNCNSEMLEEFVV